MEHVISLNLDASLSSRYQRTVTTMVGRYATPEADITITRHLPPPDDDSAPDVSISFDIPLQADASNLLDQNCDDFFSGPGFVTLSTPVPPRLLANTRRSVRKAAGTIQTPATVSGPFLEQTITTPRTAEFETPEDRAELQETRIPANPSPLPPTEPFMVAGPSTAASMVRATSITNPGSPRPSGVPSGRYPDAKLHGGPKSNTAPSRGSIAITKASGTKPGIQSTSTSVPSRAQNTHIPRQLPIPAPQKKDEGPTQQRGNADDKSDQAASSKPQGGDGLDTKATLSVSCSNSVSHRGICESPDGRRIKGQD